MKPTTRKQSQPLFKSEGGWCTAMEDDENYYFTAWKKESLTIPKGIPFFIDKIEAAMKFAGLKQSVDEMWKLYCDENNNKPKWDLRDDAMNHVEIEGASVGELVRIDLYGKDTLCGIEAIFEEEGSVKALVGIDLGIENVYSHPYIKSTNCVLFSTPIESLRIARTGLHIAKPSKAELGKGSETVDKADEINLPLVSFLEEHFNNKCDSIDYPWTFESAYSVVEAMRELDDKAIDGLVTELSEYLQKENTVIGANQALSLISLFSNSNASPNDVLVKLLLELIHPKTGA
ncbi:hypothetical protein VCHA53O466_50051 [Vibrio chagasii]|nr:hypothetical protein VCHA53O466_50051 [Vibrio chagasii]